MRCRATPQSEPRRRGRRRGALEVRSLPRAVALVVASDQVRGDREDARGRRPPSALVAFEECVGGTPLLAGERLPCTLSRVGHGTQSRIPRRPSAEGSRSGAAGVVTLHHPRRRRRLRDLAPHRDHPLRGAGVTGQQEHGIPRRGTSAAFDQDHGLLPEVEVEGIEAVDPLSPRLRFGVGDPADRLRPTLGAASSARPRPWSGSAAPTGSRTRRRRRRRSPRARRSRARARTGRRTSGPVPRGGARRRSRRPGPRHRRLGARHATTAPRSRPRRRPHRGGRRPCAEHRAGV